MNLMLKELDIRWNFRGDRVVFSIKFVDKKGCLHYFPYAVCTGLRYDVKAHIQRGIQPTDERGNAIDHVYPAMIFAIIQFNKLEVIV